MREELQTALGTYMAGMKRVVANEKKHRIEVDRRKEGYASSSLQKKL